MGDYWDFQMGSRMDRKLDYSRVPVIRKEKRKEKRKVKGKDHRKENGKEKRKDHRKEKGKDNQKDKQKEKGKDNRKDNRKEDQKDLQIHLGYQTEPPIPKACDYWWENLTSRDSW
jgi:hypothetical protein